MKNALILFTVFVITATIGLVVIAEDESQNVTVGVSRELPPPLSTQVKTTKTTQVSTHAANHIGGRNATAIACRPCRVQGRPLGNLLRFLFRPRCRWGRWRR